MNIMNKYLARKDSYLTDKEAQIIGEEVEKIREKNGNAEAKTIVKNAENEKSPLHNHFTWDNKIAGQKYREEEARYLIRVIEVEVVTVDGEHDRMRAFHAIKIDVKYSEDNGKKKEEEQKDYQHINVIKADEEKVNQIVELAHHQLMAWSHRWKIYKQLYPKFQEKYGVLFDEIEKVETKD